MSVVWNKINVKGCSDSRDSFYDCAWAHPALVQKPTTAQLTSMCQQHSCLYLLQATAAQLATVNKPTAQLTSMNVPTAKLPLYVAGTNSTACPNVRVNSTAIYLSCKNQQHSLPQCTCQQQSLLKCACQQHSCLFMLRAPTAQLAQSFSNVRVNSTSTSNWCKHQQLATMYIVQANSTACSNARANSTAASICCKLQQHSFPQCTCQQHSCLYMLKAPTAQLSQCTCQQHSCLYMLQATASQLASMSCQ